MWVARVPDHEWRAIFLPDRVDISHRFDVQAVDGFVEVRQRPHPYVPGCIAKWVLPE